MFILVAYATCHGSTRSIAERIGATLAGEGHRVEVRSVSDVDHVWQYHAVVAGSAIHDGDWLPSGAEFLHRHAGMLAERPLWLFSVGMAPAARGRRGRWFAAHAGIPRAVAVDADYIQPRDLHAFAGVLEPAHIPVRVRPFMWMIGGRFGDFRNWADVDAWAEGIADKLEAE
ncbi:flavodoxin domain-containing protein [Yinghuangia seranimata]|uniref:flavodoxin domain-containing protein n=1 Tax=Yinghuangia seranimata TaxID=408067 RepID=UPI00248C2A7E|nr:flavodoxin domain-containing protein [Yinghuangia seranimata]MDI2125451.1 flavodoxin domain-containing protein [Yinghuangia seranimata]